MRLGGETWKCNEGANEGLAAMAQQRSALSPSRAQPGRFPLGGRSRTTAPARESELARASPGGAVTEWRLGGHEDLGWGANLIKAAAYICI